MTKEEFIKKAKELGYTDAEIAEDIDFLNKYSLPYDFLILAEKPVF